MSDDNIFTNMLITLITLQDIWSVNIIELFQIFENLSLSTFSKTIIKSNKKKRNINWIGLVIKKRTHLDYCYLVEKINHIIITIIQLK